MFWKRAKTLLLNKKAYKKTTDEHASIVEPAERTEKLLPLSFLKRLIPIGRLPDDELRELKITLSKHKPGEVIFKRSEISDSISYLIKGQCFLELSNGSGYLIDAMTFNAFYPLSNDSKNQCTAIAKSDVSIIHLPQSTLQRSNSHKRNPLLNIKDIPDELQENEFFNAFCEHFKQDKLVIPSLPNVALKLRMAIQKEIGVHEAVKIINLDSVISSKLIQIVNSPLYRTVNPITTCHDAVTRLGLTTTRNLVTSISMQNLFKSDNKKLNQKIHSLWKQSIQVSSISHALASLARRVNPDEALLAGLVYNIGALPVVIFADSLNSNAYSSEDIEMTINTLQGVLGNIILDKWGFPEELKKIPGQIENWYHSSSEESDLSDIVLLAKYHSYIGSDQKKKLPPIHTLPAFQKLGDNALTPDMSLQTLHNARQQIAEAVSLFGA